jgi:hypothetical protein
MESVSATYKNKEIETFLGIDKKVIGRAKTAALTLQQSQDSFCNQ